MNDQSLNNRLVHLVALANDYCVTLASAPELERADFIRDVTSFLPRIYWEFSDIEPSALTEDPGYAARYVDEEQYESIRQGVERLLGEDDAYLETQLEDMKYSDTPIGASVAEDLADIYQDLCNFVSTVRDTGMDEIASAYATARDNFVAYWSQTLCNVMRPLNRLRYSQD